MKIAPLTFAGDVNLGMYARVSDKFCMLAHFVRESSQKKITEVLKIPVVRTTLADTDLVGLFSSLNSSGMVVSQIVDEREIHRIKSQHDVNVGILKTRYTAIGNLILANDNGALISNIFSRKEQRAIESVLDVETERTTVAGLENIGSCGVVTNKGCLLHRDATEKEMKLAEEILKVDVDIGTANFGSPFVGSCMIANNHGGLIGETTSGPEIVRIMETLGFI